ncbi:uncharacterized protein LOC132713820 [Ruditapes philippinarum]|uniref:uncharacterized protein LOC132713820 n=1 Tax=Ruditapes philippinarum TaxID=129788 RepID=UPI00295BCAAC|nr:uncharacterized protein LOC132713820 [Ruditapes philippinarum]
MKVIWREGELCREWLKAEGCFTPKEEEATTLSQFRTFSLLNIEESFTTDWQKARGRNSDWMYISVVLFATAMNLIMKSAEKTSRGPKMASGSIQPPTRAFRDDMTITAKSYVEGRWQDIGEIITWARMRFKPAKSRSMNLRKGVIQDSARYRVYDQHIPTVKEKPVKCLGKWYRGDKESKADTESQLKGWLKQVEKCGLPGKFKAWIYQHDILPRLLWPLLIYSVPSSAVEAMERTINGFLRTWFGVPKSFTSLGLYFTKSKLQLPLKALTEEYKVTKTRQVIMLRDSADEKVRKAGVKILTGRKRKAEKDAESRVRHSDIVGEGWD